MNSSIPTILYTLALDTPPIGGQRVSACITYKHRIISVGTNIRKTDPFQKRFGKTSEHIYLHAEILALKRALYLLTPDQLAKCTLYVVRLTKGGVSAPATPCIGCQKALYTFGITNIIAT